MTGVPALSLPANTLLENAKTPSALPSSPAMVSLPAARRQRRPRKKSPGQPPSGLTAPSPVPVKFMPQVGAFGAGVFAWPHGIYVDGEGNVWVTDARGGDDRGHQVIKFAPDGRELMRLGAAAKAVAVCITWRSQVQVLPPQQN